MRSFAPELIKISLESEGKFRILCVISHASGETDAVFATALELMRLLKLRK